ncbi:MAG: hypothetical protein OSJ72_10210 [Lachnospiraceae bacterium]|nr:hypothetical protein [Lachnospiraceae bacterium]
MAYYTVCPNCGCNLDPGETCDCKREQQPEQGEKEMIERGGEVFGGYFKRAGRAVSLYGDRAVRVG